MAQSRPKFLPKVESSPGSSGSYSGGVANFAVGDGNPFECDETPIFSKRKMLLRMPNGCSGHFLHLTVSKNWLVCLLAGKDQTTTLLRFFLPRDIPPGEIALEKYLAGYKITKLFLDPTGFHLLISLVPESPGLSADFLYIHGNGPKVRRIEKFKDHEITAVGFNSKLGTETSTGPILLGTSRGLIFETELMQDTDKPSYRRQLYDLGLGRAMYPVTGVELLHPPNEQRHVVIVTTPDCIHTFQDLLKPEEKSLQPIFQAYVNGTREPYIEERKTELKHSQLRLFAPPNEKYPKTWAWLCGAGIRLGELSKIGNDDVTLSGDTLISLDFEERKHLSYEERRQTIPKSLVVTEFHVLLMYVDHITGICLLNQEVVYEEYFQEQLGKLLNIVRDAFTGKVYVYTDKTIFTYNITDEARKIWSIYLEKGLFDLAEQHAREVPENLDTVLARRAEAAFEDGEYQTAANIYAKTQNTFEEVCLMFMPLEDKRPIIGYVQRRLQQLDGSLEENKPRIKVLVMWLIDLYITQINVPEQSEKWRTDWQAEYDEFMLDSKVTDCTREHCVLVKQLITQHADVHNLAQFAIANGDYEEVISQQLNAEKYAEALQTLCKQKQAELYYKYAPTLMEHLPHETIDALMAQGHKLQLDKLVPTLIVYESPKHVEQVIKYLEFAVYKLGTSNEALHNFLLRLYAEHKPTLLISYLETQGRDETLVHYDIDYALKVCTDFDVKVACVFLQCLLHMWPAAVDLALTFDVQLAKETAAKPKDEETRRRLWLLIAHHEIQGTDDVKKALNLLKECDLLRIEDLLPFFADFEKIDNFKAPICAALKDYNQKIHELQHDMDESVTQAERVREDLQNMRTRSLRIEAQETCAVCELFLLVKPFFAFVCGHKFHSDCLEKQVVPMLSSDRSRRLTMLKQQLEALLTQAQAFPEHSKQPQQQRAKRAEIKTQIEDIVAADCLYCGVLIDTVDKPFFEDWDQVNVDWD